MEWLASLPQKLPLIALFGGPERLLEDQLAKPHSGSQSNWEQPVIYYFKAHPTGEAGMNGRRRHMYSDP